MDTLYTLYIGGNFDRNGNRIPLMKAEAVFSDALRFAADKFGSGVMLLGWGSYHDSRGQYVVEKSARLEIVADQGAALLVRALAEETAARLNAESVLVTATLLAEVSFVMAPEETSQNGT